MALTIPLAITLAIFYTFGSYTAAANSFTINLLHRDSIDSPFYDGSTSFSQRLVPALRRSFINAKRINGHQKGSIYQADTIPDHGEFLLNVSYGNPPHEVLAIADTGSDLSWMQCKPCTKCYKHSAPLFDPKNSSTYKPVDCNSKTCKAISIEDTCSSSKTCHFYEAYADGSFSNGTVATETVTIGGQVLKDMVFGCSFSNDGVFRPTWAGIVGLGGGDYSLVSQLRGLVPAKFSYCLIPFPLTNGLSNKTSKMIFGDINFGTNAVITPLVQVEPKTYYFVTLEGISVGNKRLNITDGSNSSKPLLKGNMIVDSGTTLTMLPTKLYNRFETALNDTINVKTMKDPQNVLSLCYRAANVTRLPNVTMHFDGADIQLSRDNLFVTVSKHIMCLAFAPTSDLPVMGNLAQINFMIGYDLESKMLSFTRADCEKV